MNSIIRIASSRLVHNGSNIINSSIRQQCRNSRPAVLLSGRRSNSSSTPPPPTTSLKNAKTSAGTGDPDGLGGDAQSGFSMRGPVTWPALGLIAVAAASAVSYYKIERERRLENAMGKIVSFMNLLYCNILMICMSLMSYNAYQ